MTMQLHVFRDRLLKNEASTAAIEFIASDGKKTVISYKHLLSRTRQIYTLLLNRKNPKAPFIISTPKTLDLYAAVLTGVFNGIPFVPLSTSWPEEKILPILNATGADLWIGEPPLAAQRSGDVGSFFQGLSVVKAEAINALPETPWQESLSDRAYFISSSGSTGKSKLVSMGQSQFFSLLEELWTLYPLQRTDRVSNVYDLIFDPALVDIFTTFLHGATLVPLPPKDTFDVFEFIAREKISIWSSSPSLVHLSEIRNPSKSGPLESSLRRSLFTGEPLPAPLVERWQRRFPKSDIDNLYGPIEATVWISRSRIKVDGEPSRAKPISIGRCFKNFDFKVLDANDQPITSSQVGELCVSGPQVFSGYVGGEPSNLTKFPWDPQQKTWYRTGDLVHAEEGELFFHGRKDFQFKIQGVRVAPEELEAQIQESLPVDVMILPLPTTKEGLLALSPPNEGVLQRCGLILFSTPSQEVRKALKNWFQSHLPPLLHPQRAWLCSEPPLNSNGKRDRKKLIQMAQENQLELFSLEAESAP